MYGYLRTEKYAFTIEAFFFTQTIFCRKTQINTAVKPLTPWLHQNLKELKLACKIADEQHLFITTNTALH